MLLSAHVAIAMHERSKTELERLSVEAMEHQFLKTPMGQTFAPEYEAIYKEKAALRERENNLWKKAEPHFLDYLRSL